MINFFKGQKNGFTLLETLVTIVVISVVVLGSINLINNSFGLATIAKNKLIAADLAQEGFELVRNIRDVNYLNNNNWLQGLDSCLTSSGCLIDPVSGGQVVTVPAPSSIDDVKMCYGTNGYYSTTTNCGASQAVNFQRVIKISLIGAGDGGIKIISRVRWQEKGIWKDFGTDGGNFEYHLCDWKNPNPSISCY